MSGKIRGIGERASGGNIIHFRLFESGSVINSVKEAWTQANWKKGKKSQNDCPRKILYSSHVLLLSLNSPCLRLLVSCVCVPYCTILYYTFFRYSGPDKMDQWTIDQNLFVNHGNFFQNSLVVDQFVCELYYEIHIVLQTSTYHRGWQQKQKPKHKIRCTTGPSAKKSLSEILPCRSNSMPWQSDRLRLHGQ